jgi:hypothetical protein
LRQLTGIDNAGRELLLAMRLAGVRLVVEDVWMKGLIERVTGKRVSKAVLPAIGQGAVGKLDPGRQLDGVQIYMTFRQLGASLGVAFLTILLERRETLHSSRLYEHLNAANETTSTALSSMSNFLYTNSGASTTRTSLMSVGLLARAGAQTGCNSELRRLLPLYGDGRRSRILFYSSTGAGIGQALVSISF